MKNAKEFILEYLESEYSLPKDADDSFNFIETGYVDSMRMVQFIVLLEDEFGIEFTDEELTLDEFKTIGGLAGLVERKLEG